jgi:hypothetical protein
MIRRLRPKESQLIRPGEIGVFFCLQIHRCQLMLVLKQNSSESRVCVMTQDTRCCDSVTASYRKSQIKHIKMLHKFNENRTIRLAIIGVPLKRNSYALTPAGEKGLR